MTSRPFAALFVLVAAPAAGDPVLECNTDTATQIEIAQCVTETEARVAASVETALGFAMASATDLDEITGREDALPALEASQEAWEAYRDAQCAFVGASFGGGSGTGIAIQACRVELGRERAAELLRNAR